MAILESNTDLDVKGRVLATTVPNSTGSIVTWNASTKVFGLRSNAQIISDLGLQSSLTAGSHINITSNSISAILSDGVWLEDTAGNRRIHVGSVSSTNDFLFRSRHTGFVEFKWQDAAGTSFMEINGTTLRVQGLGGTGSSIINADSTGSLFRTGIDPSNIALQNGTYPNMTVGIATIATNAVKLQTARTINGTSFNGSANIVTSYWGTARNITIGNKTLSVNGSGNYSWSLAEIGASALSHTHPISDITGLQNELDKIGNLPTLTTTNKNNLVDAINEINGNTYNIEIGGRNLIVGSFNDWRSRTISQYGYSSVYIPIQDDWRGKTVTHSFEVKDIPAGESVRIRIDFYRPDTTYTTPYLGNIVSLSGKSFVSYTVTPDTQYDGIRIRILPVNFTSNYSVLFRCEKLEFGNKPTDWSPAPENQVSDWNQNDSTKFDFIKNRPTIPTPIDFITTNTNQTGLIGDKTTTGAWEFGTVKSSRLGYFGTYNSAQTQGIWSMRDDYNVSASTTTLGNQYGLAYSFIDVGGSSVASQHQVHFVSNGLATVSIGLTNGLIRANGGFVKVGQNNTQILLAGGGHRPISDFALAGSLSNYVSKTGDVMGKNAHLTFIGSGAIIKKPNITGSWARNTLSLRASDDTNLDALGHYGTSDTVHYGYLGTTTYNTTTAIRWTPNADVGIGLGSTFTPTEKLDVNGNIRVRALTSSGFVKTNAQGVLSVDTNTYALVSQLPTVNNGQLTLSTGTGLSGSASFTANQSGNSSFSVGIASTHKLPTVAEWNALPTTNTTYSAGTGISIINNVITNLAPNATHTGDVTGATALTIANSAVTNAKMANMPANTFKGRLSTTGAPQDLTVAQMQSILGISGGSGIERIQTDNSTNPGPAEQPTLYFNFHEYWGFPQAFAEETQPGNATAKATNGQLDFFASYDSVQTIVETNGGLDLELKGYHITNVLLQSPGGDVYLPDGVYAGDQVNITTIPGYQINIYANNLIATTGNEVWTFANLVWDCDLKGWVMTGFGTP